jgi:hypothetical protein
MHMDMQRCSLIGCASALTLLLGGNTALGDVIYSEDFERESSIGQFWNSTNTTNYAGSYGNFLGRFGQDTVQLDLHSQVTGGGFNPPADGVTVTPIDSSLAGGRPIYNNEGGHGSTIIPPVDNQHQLDVSDSGGSIDEGLYYAGTYAVTFDVFFFDSWDGSYEVHGPDGFAVAVNGVTLFDELFDSHTLLNNFRLPDEEPGTAAGHGSWADYIYRDIELQFTTLESMDTFIVEFVGTPSQGMSDESWGIDNVRLSTVSRSESIPAPGSVAVLTVGLAMSRPRRRSRRG